MGISITDKFKSKLLDGEEIKFTSKKSPVKLIISIIVSIILIGVGVALSLYLFNLNIIEENVFVHNGELYYVTSAENEIEMIIELLVEIDVFTITLSSVIIIFGIKGFTKNNFIITDKRVLIRKSGNNINVYNYKEIKGVSAKKRLLGQLFDYGTIIIFAGTTNTEYKVYNIKKYYDGAILLKDIVDANEKEKYDL